MAQLPGLEGYKAQKVQDGFDIIKGNFNCGFEYCRFEETKETPERESTRYLGYELIIIGPDNIGRKLWKRFYLDNESNMKKLADMVWTVIGKEFQTEEDLALLLDELTSQVVKVRAWGWTPSEDVKGNPIPENKQEARQQHMIKGVNEEGGVGGDNPKF